MKHLLKIKAGAMPPATAGIPGNHRVRPGSRLAVGILVLFLATVPPALADPLAFTGDTLITFSSGTILPGVDLSGLQFGTTLDGVEISGNLSVSFEDTGVPTAGALTIQTERFFVAPIGTDIVPLAHASGSYTNGEGGLWITSVSVETLLSPQPALMGPCAASATLELGTLSGPGAASGSFDVTTTENNVNPATPCSTVGDDSGPFQNSLTQTFSVSYFFTGSAGSFTIDLGNSILSEMTIPTPEPPEPPVTVPEPSGAFLLGGTFLFLAARSYGRRNGSVG